MSGVVRWLSGAPKATTVAGFKVQTSVNGVPIPIVYGTARVAGNLIHMPKTPVLQGGNSSKIAGSKGAASGQTYIAPMVIALCEGPIDGIGYVWRDKDGKLTYDGNYDTSGWFKALGTSSQTAWPYLSTNYPAEAFTYQFTAYVANDKTPLPNDSMSSYSWEIAGFLRFAPSGLFAGIVDALPPAIINDLLTNTSFGLAWSSARIGDLTAFTDYCAANGLFASPVIDTQSAATDPVNELLEVGNTGAVWSDGVLKLVPYGDVAATGNGHTYTPNTTPEYDLTDGDFLPRGGDLDPILVTRKDPATAYNQVTVEYEDRDNDYNTTTYTATDQASYEKYGPIPMPTLSLHSIKQAAIAQLVAQVRLQREQNIWNTYQFNLGWRFSLLEPMDLVTLTDPGLGLDQTVVRLTVTEELADEQGIACTAEDWPFGSASATAYATPTSTGTAPNANVDPGDTTTPLIFEGPRPLQSAPLELWVGGSGGDDWGGCDVYLSVDNVNFEKVGQLVAKAAFGLTTASLATNAAYPSIDTTHTLAVDISGSGRTLVAQSQDQFDNLIPLCYVGGEFLDYRDLSITGAGLYSLSHLYRGLYGSTIPSSHASGSSFILCDASIIRIPWPVGYTGQVLYFKFPAFNIYGAALQDISTLTSVSHTVGQDPIIAPGSPTLTVTTTPGPTSYSIDWTGDNVEVAIDGGSYAAPASNPLVVTLDADSHVYAFRAELNGLFVPDSVTIPALNSSTPSGTYSSLTNTLNSDGNPGLVDFGYAWSGPSVDFHLYVRDVGRFGDEFYHLHTTISAGASSPYTYTAGEEILPVHGPPFVTIGFYLEATSGSTNGVTSVTTEAQYPIP